MCLDPENLSKGCILGVRHVILGAISWELGVWKMESVSMLRAKFADY